MKDSHDLERLLRSRIPLILIESRDEKRVTQLFARLAIRLAQPVLSWSVINGLQCIDYAAMPQEQAYIHLYTGRASMPAVDNHTSRYPQQHVADKAVF